MPAVVVIHVQGYLWPAGYRAQGYPSQPSPVSASLRRLAAATPLVLVDYGPVEVLESWFRDAGLEGGVAFRLWCRRLGRQARPPSRLPFRFLERRFDLRPADALLVSRDAAVRDAASRCGWPLWGLPDDPNVDSTDLNDLADWVAPAAVQRVGS